MTTNQFSIATMRKVNVLNVNIRSELHGDEHVPAADISLKMTTSNHVLSEFDPELRAMLYAKPDGALVQDNLDGFEVVSDLPTLRCVMLEQPVKLKNQFHGYTLTIDRGLGGESNIVVGDCEVNKLRADCMDGGTVGLLFRVQASGLDADTIGKLAMLIGSETSITLTPAEPKQADLADADNVTPISKAKPDAGQIFAASFSTGG